MAHRQHALLGAIFGSGTQNGVEKRKKRGFAFERKAFGAEISRLNRLFENLRLDEEIENTLAIHGSAFRFHALLNPEAALAIGDMHVFDADRPAVEAARRVGIRARKLQLRNPDGIEYAEGIEVCLQVSPSPERIPYSFLRLAPNRRLHEHMSPAHCVSKS